MHESTRQQTPRTLAEFTETCVLDVAERGVHTLEEVAVLLNITRERVRQIEVVALVKLRRRLGVERPQDDDDDA